MQTERISYLLLACLLNAAAGGMGWGIRGQYGHETGAMIAGVLMGFTLVLLFLPQASSLTAARTVALTAIGISFGGSMTYGQTIGLTHDAPLVGDWAALRWGLVGLSVKGGIWMGFAGAFLGMALGGRRYRPLEMAMLTPVLLAALCLGLWALNQPFDPDHRILPRFYFSDHWHWEPGADLEPRPENWGGLLFALVGLVAYAGWVRRDRLARNMALAGVIAGGIGFPCGQCVQAIHAWNIELFENGALSRFSSYLQYVNWWNMMEITFGAISGFVLAAGLWWNQRLISAEPVGEEERFEIPPAWEFVLFACHLFFLAASEFLPIRILGVYQAYGLILCALPLMGVMGGRYWPYLGALPVVAAPIAAKTLRELSYKNAVVEPATGWALLVAAPLAAALAAALWFARQGRRGRTSHQFARIGLLLAVWLYFALNFAFFRVPWPWAEWTGRTPSGLIFLACAVALTLAAIFVQPRRGVDEAHA